MVDTRQGVSDDTSLKEEPQTWALGRRGQGWSPSKRQCLLVLGRKLGLVCRCPRNLPPALCPLPSVRTSLSGKGDCPWFQTGHSRSCSPCPLSLPAPPTFPGGARSRARPRGLEGGPPNGGDREQPQEGSGRGTKGGVVSDWRQDPD